MRYAPLAASGAETDEHYEQIRQNRDQANSQMAQSTAAVHVAERQVETLRAQIRQGEAQIEQAQAQVRQAQLADAEVQLAAEVAQAYVNLRDAQQRQELLRQSVEIEQHMLDLNRQRRTYGTATQSEVERLETQLAQTEAQLFPLQASEDESLDRPARRREFPAAPPHSPGIAKGREPPR